MHRTAVRWLLAIAFGLASGSPALAQFGVASLSHADGGVTRLHRGAPAATTIGVSIMDGDQIETTNGRAEVAYLDGSVIYLDKNAQVIVNAGDRLQVLSGRVSLRTSGMRPYVAESMSAKLHVRPGAVVEITANPEKKDVLLRVITGSARIETPWGSQQVPDYHTALISGPTSAPFLTKVAPIQADEFERWALARTVMSTSTALKGSAAPGGVAYDPYAFGYYGGYYGGYYYSAPSYVYYPYYYVRPYYSSYYTVPYYNTYSSPYYSRSYYSAPYSYYNPYSRPYYDTYRWPASPTRDSGPMVTPYRPPSAPMTPATGMGRGTTIPKQ